MLWVKADYNIKNGVFNHFYRLECLISGDVINTTSRIPRYSNNLRNLLPSNDVSVMEIAAKTLVKLALLPGSKGAESFDFDMKRAFEWLSEERNEVKICYSIIYFNFIVNVLAKTYSLFTNKNY